MSCYVGSEAQESGGEDSDAEADDSRLEELVWPKKGLCLQI